ncbi:hypothetical protein AK812_SmicGene43568 [Symbiodinium microadriaticum]|uniref:Uncharacterized protein n=1 Tax=Symbiodinium microadriaticum TaxID=2951 RepID=A0A1Q9C0P3_SYMMI|nr:hypothetical protein AK812_SmicGene43568 [Symbiodinium microadriaticum]
MVETGRSIRIDLLADGDLSGVIPGQHTVLEAASGSLLQALRLRDSFFALRCGRVQTFQVLERAKSFIGLDIPQVARGNTEMSVHGDAMFLLSLEPSRQSLEMDLGHLLTSTVMLVAVGGLEILPVRGLVLQAEGCVIRAHTRTIQLRVDKQPAANDMLPGLQEAKEVYLRVEEGDIEANQEAKRKGGAKRKRKDADTRVRARVWGDSVRCAEQEADEDRQSVIQIAFSFLAPENDLPKRPPDLGVKGSVKLPPGLDRVDEGDEPDENVSDEAPRKSARIDPDAPCE